MRGVLIVSIILSLLILSSCSLEQEKPSYWDVSDFNTIKIIDYPYETIDANELESIHEVFKNENKAISLYRKTLDLFKNEEPFGSILLQEELQIGLLEEVYAKYELNFPDEDNWYPKVVNFENPYQACAASVVYAQQSIDLYNDWLDNDGLNYKIDNQDLRFLYTKIRDDYSRNYLPTFKRCARKLK